MAFGGVMMGHAVAVHFDDDPRRAVFFGGLLAEDSVENQFQPFETLALAADKTPRFARLQFELAFVAFRFGD